VVQEASPASAEGTAARCLTRDPCDHRTATNSSVWAIRFHTWTLSYGSIL